MLPEDIQEPADLSADQTVLVSQSVEEEMIPADVDSMNLSTAST